MAICEVLEQCGGCENISLEEKINKANSLLNFENFSVFESQDSAFRARAELAIYHKDNKLSFAMRSKGDVESKFICIKNCKNLALNLQKTLNILNEILNTSDFFNFKTKFFSIIIF